ncbi:META domain-containing protein [Sphingomonas sp. So64.6b]|uniref:META domain-containing protein n=1 Tax=Sphingomonas sp. So64.6b TaxID=2997354 RepID=UPI0016013209|nr:META domain-containing protein [Sphingomonas sp. So64.6b]QNA83977.1 META domain-containing protein [Sphingomonas sp. So64.6b]
MKFALALAAPALLLTAPVLAATQRPLPYKAVGTEPGWTLSIDRGLIRYVGDYGRTKVTTKAPVARPSFNGLRYVTRRITVDVTRVRCSDGMSDRVFPDKVTVKVGRRTVSGCGGNPIIASAPAIAGAWRIESVSGQLTRGAKSASITFSDDRVSGNTGCNGFSGAFRFERGFLTAGPLASTRMACPPRGMAQEQAILGVLGQRLSVSSNQNGKLVLSGRGQARLVLSPARRD